MNPLIGVIIGFVLTQFGVIIGYYVSDSNYAPYIGGATGTIVAICGVGWGSDEH